MPEHYEQATAAPNELRSLPDTQEQTECAEQGHLLLPAGDHIVQCDRCGARFGLVEW